MVRWKKCKKKKGILLEDAFFMGGVKMLEKLIEKLYEILQENFPKASIKQKMKDIQHPKEDVFYLDLKKSETKNLGMYGYRDQMTMRIVFVERQDMKSSDGYSPFFVYDKLMKVFSRGRIETKNTVLEISSVKGGGVEDFYWDKVGIKDNRMIFMDVRVDIQCDKEKTQEQGIPAKEIYLKY